MYKFVVLSCLAVVATAGVISSPLAYSAPYGYDYSLAYTVPLYNPSNYRDVLSLAPGQPANILGADGRPLDTLEVNLDRSAHLAAKAFDGHVLKKRSAPLPYLAGLFKVSVMLHRTWPRLLSSAQGTSRSRSAPSLIPLLTRSGKITL
nr:uncharacterized protein LOC128677425 [Plodia interpunctella]